MIILNNSSTWTVTPYSASDTNLDWIVHSFCANLIETPTRRYRFQYKTQKVRYTIQKHEI